MGGWIIPLPPEVAPCPVPQCWEQTHSTLLHGITLSCLMAPCSPTILDWEGDALPREAFGMQKPT